MNQCVGTNCVDLSSGIFNPQSNKPRDLYISELSLELLNLGSQFLKSHKNAEVFTILIGVGIAIAM